MLMPFVAISRAKNGTINLLFLRTGTLAMNTKTPEDLHLAASLFTYSRNRFILNLLPLIQAAQSLRRVVSVLAGTKERPMDISDFQGLKALAKKAHKVSFIHDFPGPVKSGIGLDAKGALMSVMKALFAVIGLLVNMPVKEAGERHLYLATSARYPVATGVPASGVTVDAKQAITIGTTGREGSGVYSVDSVGDSAGPNVVALLAKMREEGVDEKAWEDQEEQFRRITGGDDV